MYSIHIGCKIIAILVMEESVSSMALVRQQGVVPAVKKKKKKVREAMRMVVGDLEHVLGELKTVVGDLQVLVNQIDEVTNKIDEEYGPDFRQEERATRSNLSLEGMCQNEVVVRSRSFRDSKTQNIVYTQSQWLCLRSDYTVLTQNIVSDYSPNEERIKISGHVPSSDTSGCVMSSKETSPETDRIIQKRPRQLSTQCFMQSNRAHLGLFSPMSLNSPESPFDFPLPLPSPNSPLTPNLPEVPGCPGHVMGLPTPGQPQQSDYCGVYEHELDMQLELALDEDLDNRPFLDERNILSNETFSEYQAARRDRVNMWTAYTVRDININPVGWLSDPFVNSPTSEMASQDLLNDNLAKNLPTPEYHPLWAGSVGGSSDRS